MKKDHLTTVETEPTNSHLWKYYFQFNPFLSTPMWEACRTEDLNFLRTNRDIINIWQAKTIDELTAKLPK